MECPPNPPPPHTFSILIFQMCFDRHPKPAQLHVIFMNNDILTDNTAKYKYLLYRLR